MKDREVLQIRISKEQKDRGKKVAAYKGGDLSSMIRNYIDSAYARLPKEAK